MRLETQKQIVKAFAMMYEDTDMPLSELIEKLQQLGGAKEEKKQNLVRNYRKVSDQQILDATPNDPVAIGEIMKKLPKINRRSLNSRLDNLVAKERMSKTKIHPRLVHWAKL